MADKAGKNLSGPLFIEVEYDYEYEAKDKRIVIKQGEKYILVKKTNDDWWQVKKDENSKPFYVPAQYVKELTRKALMPPIRPLIGLSNNSLKLAHGLQRSTENVNKSPELSTSGKSFLVQAQDANQNLGPNSSPEYMETEKTSFLQEQPCDSVGEGSEKIHQDSESGDDLSSSSTEQVQPVTPPSQGRPDSPVYANLQELKISQSALPPVPISPAVQISGEWETHKDITGRYYYYKRNTGENLETATLDSGSKHNKRGLFEPSRSRGNFNTRKLSQSL